MEGFFPGILIGSIFWAIIFCFSQDQTDESWKKQIANHGAAHFYIDANNDRQWDWKTCGPTVEVK